MSNTTKEIRSIQHAELRAAKNEDGSRTISGLIPYNSLSEDLGGFKEMIAPGAFSNALVQGADVLALRDHKSELLMGRTKSGTLSLEDSPKGLRFTCKLPDTTQAADLAASIHRGDLDANSFGFTVIEDKWTSDPSGNVLRTLLSVELFEISPCSMPAYTGSSVSIRSCPSDIRSLIEAEKRDDMDDDEQDSTACKCECPECLTGNCSDCSNDGCDDPNCDCADDDSDEFDSVRCLMHMRLELAKRSLR